MKAAHLAIAGLLVSTSALADAPADGFNTDCAKARAEKKVCVIIVEVPHPPPPIVRPWQITPQPLIRVPKDFIREMMKSVEDI